MSRVDDDRDAARMAARLAETRRAEEGKKTDKAAADSTFKKLVGKGQQEGTQRSARQQTKTGQQENVARSAIEHMLEAHTAPAGAAAGQMDKGVQQQQESAFKSKLGFKAADEQVQQSSRSDGEGAQKTRLAGDQGTAQTTSGRAADQGQAAGRSAGRHADARVSSSSLEERKEASDSAGAGRAAAGSGKGEKGDLKTDTDKGGSSGQGGGGRDSKDGAPAMGPGFRFNPALQAPVPVARAREASGSDRLRKIANEMAQKIVDKVRVGTNAAGKVEFQIDMRSDVLAGLSVKVSAHNGKISAVFSGSDQDVLKLIEEQGDELKAALAKRGLSLEDFKIETRA